MWRRTCETFFAEDKRKIKKYSGCLGDFFGRQKHAKGLLEQLQLAILIPNRLQKILPLLLKFCREIFHFASRICKLLLKLASVFSLEQERGGR